MLDSRTLLLLTVSFLSSCAGASDRRVVLDPAAQGVELVTGAPRRCQPLGDVVGTAVVEGDEAAAMREAHYDVQNKAHALGATHVALQTTNAGQRPAPSGPRFSVISNGVAYRCPR